MAECKEGGETGGLLCTARSACVNDLSFERNDGCFFVELLWTLLLWRKPWDLFLLEPNMMTRKQKQEQGDEKVQESKQDAAVIYRASSQDMIAMSSQCRRSGSAEGRSHKSRLHHKNLPCLTSQTHHRNNSGRPIKAKRPRKQAENKARRITSQIPGPQE